MNMTHGQQFRDLEANFIFLLHYITEANVLLLTYFSIVLTLDYHFTFNATIHAIQFNVANASYHQKS